MRLPEQLGAAARLPDASLDWPIEWAGVEVIAMAESCRLKAYRCPAGIWTIGWGQTDGVRPGMVWTQEQADLDLCNSLADYALKVLAMVDGQASPGELAALVSLAYNIGPGALAKSTVLRLHKAGNRQGAARAFALWNKARVGGVLQPLAGLTRRRAIEAALYLEGDSDVAPARMPQAVEPESSLAASPIARTGGVVAGAGALELASGASDQLGAVGSVVQQGRALMVDTLGVPTDWALPALLLAAGVAIWYWRRKQRAEGWA